MKKILTSSLLITALIVSTFPAEAATFGTTFSPKQCDYLGLDWKETYLKILDFPFDMIRLGAYWNEIEKKEGEFDFSALDWLIKKAKERKISIVLIVGMKSPRWPEYHIPGWASQRVNTKSWQVISKYQYLQEKTLHFIHKVVERYNNEDIIKYWQVENEPLNRFGGRYWRIDKDFLADEVQLVRKLDARKRPVVLTVSTYPNNFLRIVAEMFTNAKPIRESLQMTDILGINVYPLIGQKFLGWPMYYKSRKSSRMKYFDEIFSNAEQQNKNIWVTELQAEPWEPGKLVYQKSSIPPTGSPDNTRKTLEELTSLGYTTFFFWGAEYWYDQKKNHNNPLWWNTIGNLMAKHKDTILAADLQQ